MILDVGCGCSPRGDVNVDLLVGDDDLKWDLNPQGIPNFIKAAVEFLPFRDHCFDLVFSSHVLEHLEDPDLAVKEFLRVSRKAVWIIVPFGLFSLFDVFYQGRNFGNHRRWLKKHHKHFFLMDPLKTGSFKLHFVNLFDAIRYKRKSFTGWLRIPIPFEVSVVLEAAP